MSTLPPTQAIAFEYFGIILAHLRATEGVAYVGRAALPYVVGQSPAVKKAALLALAKKGVIRLESYSLPVGDGYPAGTLYCCRKDWQPSFSLGTVIPFKG